MPAHRITIESVSAWIAAVLLVLVTQLVQPGNGHASPFESNCSSPQLNGTSEIAVRPAVAHQSLAGRHRLEFRMGYWDSGRRQNSLPSIYMEEKTRVENLVGTLSYAYWGYDKLATDITFKGLVAEATSIDGASGASESAVVVTSALFGIRLYPISSIQTLLRPYITAGIGPYIGIESHEEFDNHGIRTLKTTKTLGSFGGYLGCGLDIQIGRHLMGSVHGGYNLMADFPEKLGSENNYSGVELSAGISLLFG